MTRPNPWNSFSVGNWTDIMRLNVPLKFVQFSRTSCEQTSPTNIEGWEKRREGERERESKRRKHEIREIHRDAYRLNPCFIQNHSEGWCVIAQLAWTGTHRYLCKYALASLTMQNPWPRYYQRKSRYTATWFENLAKTR